MPLCEPQPKLHRDLTITLPNSRLDPSHEKTLWLTYKLHKPLNSRPTVQRASFSSSLASSIGRPALLWPGFIIGHVQQMKSTYVLRRTQLRRKCGGSRRNVATTM